MGAQRLPWSSFPIIKLDRRPPTPPTASRYSSSANIPARMSVRSNSHSGKPILLFDIMDTIVRDPFYHHIPPFFGMSMKELLECKHPTAWIEFEKGLISEMELARMFFKDGRPIDLEGLKSCMRQGYTYIPGIEELLADLKKNGYEMHSCTNYPIWYEIIEEKLKLSTFISWTFCSCLMGKRKPDPDFYMDILKHLNVEPACCIFIDDRMRNVEAAIDVGFNGIQYKNVELLRKELANLGVLIETS
ncbi:Haloacid dehalogenase-like hydrolase (HAD) superfamily protein [Striga hermonthica]|uniref:Haloacid dehalogenase-like hydrolase (HAD) superfamily protein n=1 Tax=Striga hermonthica TaxID=68872 RepID=A0A9N7N8U2_STRHE|nr:Haloacid dehalogenase-like hydrolase (HAD) superfamily protein [Striga hermonthica]